ncbi:MAG: pitrilysin family protein [Bacteroidota bacterium]
MINYERIVLKNGLRVISHYDPNTPLAAINILYNVGSKDEHPNKTGFAHLFEHLMFEGSENAPSYDDVVQEMSGENNAFTNTDITNYYVSIPAQNMEKAFWLESDRMNALTISEEKCQLQQHVVIEEFKQRYLNQPYGDLWLLMRPLTYKAHPYQWATIGKDISHIENATIEDVQAFYNKFYTPDNAILVVSGNVQPEVVFQLAEKWFGSIEKKGSYIRNLPKEPLQLQQRTQVVKREVPHNILLKTYHICKHQHPDYYALDLISDILSSGNSSRFHQQLVKKQRLFTEVSALMSGEIEEGLFYISGLLAEKVDFCKALTSLNEQIEKIQHKPVPMYELNKVKSKIVTYLAKSNLSILNKAMDLAFAEALGNVSLMNKKSELYQSVTQDDIMRVAQQYLQEKNSCVLEYWAV